MVDWSDLRYLLAVARHGSTTAAAKALGVNQSTVHRRLAELERQLGRRLVERYPTGYRLTALGEELRPLAERVETGACTTLSGLPRLATLISSARSALPVRRPSAIG
jgi:molybdate transport repressor ModE-like protein